MLCTLLTPAVLNVLSPIFDEKEYKSICTTRYIVTQTVPFPHPSRQGVIMGVYIQGYNRSGLCILFDHVRGNVRGREILTTSWINRSTRGLVTRMDFLAPCLTTHAYEYAVGVELYEGLLRRIGVVRLVLVVRCYDNVSKSDTMESARRDIGEDVKQQTTLRPSMSSLTVTRLDPGDNTGRAQVTIEAKTHAPTETTFEIYPVDTKPLSVR